jgi:hypothetical protein
MDEQQPWHSARRKRGRGGSAPPPSAWEERLQSALAGEQAWPRGSAGAENHIQRQGTTLDEDRGRRQKRQSENRKRKYSEWICDHCSTSNFVLTLENKQSTTCRRCSALRLRDSVVLQGHGQVAETFAQMQQLPTKGNVIYEDHPATSRSAMVAQPKRDRTRSGMRPTPLQQASLTLELAVAAGYPEQIVIEMKEHMKKLETQQKEALPIGQRYDQARKRLNQAKKASDDSLQALKDVTANREMCTAELEEAQKAFDDVAAQRHSMEQEQDEEQNGIPRQEYEMFANLLDAVDATWLPPIAGGHADPPERLLSAIQQCREKIQCVLPTRRSYRTDYGTGEGKDADEADIDIDSSDEEDEAATQRDDADERWGIAGYAAQAASTSGPTEDAQGQRRARATAPDRAEAASPVTPPRKKPRNEDERKEKRERRAKAEALLAEVEQIAQSTETANIVLVAAGAVADAASATAYDCDTAAANMSKQSQQSYARICAKHMRVEKPY